MSEFKRKLQIEEDLQKHKLQNEYNRIKKFKAESPCPLEFSISCVWSPAISRETLKELLLHLDIATLGICTGVCKSWYQLGNEDIFWEKLSMCFYNYSQPPKNGWKKRVISRFLFQNKLKLLLRINQDILGLKTIIQLLLPQKKYNKLKKNLGLPFLTNLLIFSLYIVASVFFIPHLKLLKQQKNIGSMLKSGMIMEMKSRRS